MPKSKLRKEVVKKRLKEIWEDNWFGRMKNLMGKRKESEDQKTNAHHINRMTNWQNTKWSQAGYPKDRVEEFASMERPKR